MQDLGGPNAGPVGTPALTLAGMRQHTINAAVDARSSDEPAAPCRLHRLPGHGESVYLPGHGDPASCRARGYP